MSAELSWDILAWKEIDWKKLTEFNVTKLQRSMRDHQIDALIVQSLDNFQYITGYRVPANINLMHYLHRQGAILPAEGDQPIMLPGLRTSSTQDISTGLKMCDRCRSRLDCGRKS